MGHILVVDDEPAIVTVVRERLEREGFTVRAVASGEEALAHIDADPADLVVLDVMLPGIDGLEVLRRLRSTGDTVPVIVLTARDEDVDKIVGLELGADDYLVKPFNPRELSARVRAVDHDLSPDHSVHRDRPQRGRLHLHYPLPRWATGYRTCCPGRLLRCLCCPPGSRREITGRPGSYHRRPLRTPGRHTYRTIFGPAQI